MTAEDGYRPRADPDRTVRKDGLTQCGAPTKQGDGAPCRNRAGMGTDHVGYGACKKHFGKAQPQKNAAAREQAEDELRRLFPDGDLPPIDNPLTTLARIAAEVVWFKDALGERVNKLTSVGYAGITGEQLRAEVVLLERAFDRCEKFLTAMARLDIDTRLAAIQDTQVSAVMAAIDGACDDADLTSEQGTAVKLALATRLRT